MMARLFHARAGSPERTVILARKKAYHGVTFAARAATGLDAFHADIGPLPPDFVHLTPPEPYRMDDTAQTSAWPSSKRRSSESARAASRR